MTARGWTSLRAALEGARRVLLTGPTGPDGDSIGACLALQRVLARRDVSCAVAGVPGFRYAFMPGAAEMVADEDVEPVYDAVVVLDGDRHRLHPRVAAAFASAEVRGIIDHHASTREDGYTHAWVDGGATSTCEMLYSAWQEDGTPLDPLIAELLYVGAIFDTGGFRYSNTTPATHRMAATLLEQGIDHAGINARVLMSRRPAGIRAAGDVYSRAVFHAQDQLLVGRVDHGLATRLGIGSGDMEGVVDSLVYVQGVEVAALLNERDLGEVKISLRSRGKVNVAKVAQTLSSSGGGHAKAAGACLEMSLEEAHQRVVDVVSEALGIGVVA